MKEKNKENNSPFEFWKDECKKSNGTMFLVPEQMDEQTKEFQKKSKEFIDKATEFDRLNAEFDVYAKNFWFNMRKEFEKMGNKDIWAKNMGWNKQAMEEGVSVVNLTSGK